MFPDGFVIDIIYEDAVKPLQKLSLKSCRL